MISTADVLIAARKRIETGWIQDTFAEDDQGNPVKSTDATACKWCLAGALYRADSDLGSPGPLTTYAFDALADEVGETDIEAWNDAPGRTQAEVSAMISRVILKLSR